MLEDKSKSHGNNFIIKDVRAHRGKGERKKLLLMDFVRSDKAGNEFKIANKDVVIFNN